MSKMPEYGIQPCASPSLENCQMGGTPEPVGATKLASVTDYIETVAPGGTSIRNWRIICAEDVSIGRK
jgi:hypothetical protein